MKKLKRVIIDAPEYSVFIDDNRNILSDINRQVLDITTALSEKQKTASGLIDELIRLAEISVTIHQQYTDNTGDGEIFKLKSVLATLKKHTMADSIHIQTAEYLIQRIEKLINSAFTSLDPELVKEKHECPEHREPAADLKYKWLTFIRNGSWFILPYKHLKIFEADPAFIKRKDGKNYITVNDNEFEITDMMSLPGSEFRLPASLLQIDSADFLYASDFNGREVHASSDIVSSMIKPLKDHAESIYKGRVRLFGVKYLCPDTKRLKE